MFVNQSEYPIPATLYTPEKTTLYGMAVKDFRKNHHDKIWFIRDFRGGFGYRCAKYQVPSAKCQVPSAK